MSMQQEEVMAGAGEIRNKVAESGIITLDLAPYVPPAESLAEFDLKPFLFMGMILKEKDYRASLLTHDWSAYAHKHVGITCSADAIIPVWAYMLAATYLQPVAASVHYASLPELSNLVISSGIAQISVEEYSGKRIVLKGCGDTPVPASAYVAASARLRPVAKSLMYGEPCSTVPIYKSR